METNNRQLTSSSLAVVGNKLSLISLLPSHLLALSTSVLSRKLSGFLRPLEDTITSTNLASLLLNTIASRCDNLCTSIVYHLWLIEASTTNFIFQAPSLLQLFCFSQIFPRSLVSVRASLPVREPHFQSSMILCRISLTVIASRGIVSLMNK